jgi:putative ABC transport system permease protein
MKTLGFAWRSLVRQPARSTLGVLGVAAVGALLFDMLLLSQGLVVSMRDLLDRSGFDIRVAATDTRGPGPLMDAAAQTAARIAALPSVRSALTLRIADAWIEHAGRRIETSVQGVGGGVTHPWTVTRGRDVTGPRELMVNESGARRLGLDPGATVIVRASCSRERESLPPVSFRVAGIARFPFDDEVEPQAATDARSLAVACGEDSAEAANMILVTSAGDATAAAAAITALAPDLRALTNAQAIGRLQETGFTYFQQISAVLTTVTVTFALLLITVLLTVSVNQRLGEIAALRALGFSRRRVVGDVLCESALIVGIGAVCSIPLGVLLAAWLDAILKGMPGVPSEVHFFVFERKALGLHAALMVTTAIAAALYPMSIVARLPIAATLRNEIGS